MTTLPVLGTTIMPAIGDQQAVHVIHARLERNNGAGAEIHRPIVGGRVRVGAGRNSCRAAGAATASAVAQTVKPRAGGGIGWHVAIRDLGTGHDGRWARHGRNQIRALRLAVVRDYRAGVVLINCPETIRAAASRRTIEAARAARHSFGGVRRVQITVNVSAVGHLNVAHGSNVTPGGGYSGIRIANIGGK